MTVITIHEDNHGFLAVAKDYKSAVAYLVNNNWFFEFYNDRTGTYDRVTDEMIDEMTEKWDINDFNDFWENTFYLYEEEVFG